MLWKMCLESARGFASERWAEGRRKKHARRETMEIRKQGREEKEGNNVATRTEVVVQDKNNHKRAIEIL